MRRLLPPVLVLLLTGFGGAKLAEAGTPLVASVSITTPAESLAARDHAAARVEHLAAHASPARAALLSLGATVVPVVVGAEIAGNTSHDLEGGLLIGSGILFGPAVGYYDSGLYGRGTRGLALRLAVSVLSAGVALGTAATIHGGDLEDYEGPFLVILGGAALTTLLAAVDCALVAPDVARAQRASFSVAPVVAPGSGTPGVGVMLRF